MSSSQNPQDQFDDGNTPRAVRKNDLEKLIEVLDKLLQFRWTTHKFLETGNCCDSGVDAVALWGKFADA